MLWLGTFLQKQATFDIPIIHFAAEKFLENQFRQRYGENYLTADLIKSADLRLNIEQIELESGSVGTIICNHVLEHVDDTKALNEMFRILKSSGTLITSVPIIEGWERTYENPDVTTPKDRELHFGQYDHIRYYGRDFREKLREAGFVVGEITAEGPDVVRYGLSRGQKVFICSKRILRDGF